MYRTAPTVSIDQTVQVRLALLFIDRFKNNFFFKYYVFMIGLAPRRQFEVRGEEKMELYPANPTVRLHLTQRIFFLKSLDLISATPVRLFTTMNSKMMKNLIFYSSFFITNRIWPLSKN